jgi:hypothetical protein
MEGKFPLPHEMASGKNSISKVILKNGDNSKILEDFSQVIAITVC